MVTPVDFHTLENLRTRWIRGIDVDAGEHVQGEMQITEQRNVEIEGGSKPARDAEVIMRLVF